MWVAAAAPCAMGGSAEEEGVAGAGVGAHVVVVLGGGGGDDVWGMVLGRARGLVPAWCHVGGEGALQSLMLLA